MRPSILGLVGLASLVGLLTSACFAPPWDGEGTLKCAATEPQCPPGLVCVSGACWYKDIAPDAGADLMQDGMQTPPDLIKPNVGLGWENPMPSFGVVKLATTSPRVFRLVNTGVTPLSGIVVTTLGDAAFAITTNDCAGVTLNDGEGCNVTVGFTPTEKKTYSGVLRAEANGKSASLTLSGAGGNPATLSITIAGTGSGGVSALGGISCTTGTCNFTVEDGTTISLNSVVNTGSTFDGWSMDAASCATTTPCEIQMTGNRAVTATYSIKTFSVTLRKYNLSGADGTISLSGPGGVGCGVSCIATTSVLPYGQYMLSGVVDGGTNVVLGWPQGCSGTASSCMVSVDADKTFVVVFGPPSNYVFALSLDVAPGALGGVGGADTRCQNAASAAGLPDAASFRAWLSTSSINARDRLGTARGWVRPDGLPVADAVTSFASATGSMWFPPSLTADKLSSPWNGAVTGTKADGTLNAAASCGDFASTSGSTMTGLLGGGFPEWTEYIYTQNCSDTFLAIYCFGTGKTTTLTLPTIAGRKAFVTANPLGPPAGSFVSTLDTACQTAGGAATYKAFVSPGAMSVQSRFDLTKQLWVRPDGVPIAFDLPRLFTSMGGPLVPLAFDQNGMAVSGQTWTGSIDPSQVSDADCSDWTMTTANTLGGNLVKATSANGTPFKEFSIPCNSSQAVLCLDN